MQLSTFQEKINLAAEKLLNCTAGGYICLLLIKYEYADCNQPCSISQEAVKLFIKLFRPKDCLVQDSFYGEHYKPENQQIRVKKLREFEQYCIEHKSYLDW